MKKRENWADLCKLTGIFFMVIAVVYTTQIRKIKLTKISLINSAFFPKICVCALILLSVCEIYQGIKSWKVSEDTEEEKKDYRSAALTLGFSLIYVMLLEPLGFLISSVLYMVAQMAVLCPKGEQKPVLYVLVSVIAAVVIYFLFRDGLNLMLPSGILTGIL